LRELHDKAKAELLSMTESLGVFIKSFDHRYSGQPLGEHAQAVARAARFLGTEGTG
jgi:hypothetical protein